MIFNVQKKAHSMRKVITFCSTAAQQFTAAASHLYEDDASQGQGLPRAVGVQAVTYRRCHKAVQRHGLPNLPPGCAVQKVRYTTAHVEQGRVHRFRAA